MNDRGRKVRGNIADTHARNPVVGSVMLHDGRLRIRFVVVRIVKGDRERRKPTRVERSRTICQAPKPVKFTSPLASAP